MIRGRPVAENTYITLRNVQVPSLVSPGWTRRDFFHNLWEAAANQAQCWVRRTDGSTQDKPASCVLTMCNWTLVPQVVHFEPTAWKANSKALPVYRICMFPLTQIWSITLNMCVKNELRKTNSPISTWAKFYCWTLDCCGCNIKVNHTFLNCLSLPFFSLNNL